MARALIVGCGCRGRMLGAALAADGWAVRGTSRREAGLEAVEAAGLEPAASDPDLPGTVLDALDGVAVVHWLMGSARGDAGAVAALHGQRLESLLARIVETGVRGFVYESAGSAPSRHLQHGAALVEAASARWRIPTRAVDADPASPGAWLEAMRAAAHGVLGAPAETATTSAETRIDHT